MKNIMKRAWEIARQAVESFGGKAIEYIAEALRMAWAEAKNIIKPVSERIEELEGLGFNRWTKAGFDRLYINATHLGLVVSYYKTGNVSYAEFEGCTISNCEARRMLASKTYIDVKTGEVHSDRRDLAERAKKLARLV